ncbi:MAG: branched-chain amino acid transport system ATP-binding protein [Rhodocyclaceae bacterium]|nr:MAG: branched-chain amino acid transport system ATP-binding protein [Rhodocyclaceae bacterium]TND01508.1 MAG: branched-chain amino acid transport system ATP-binding protein [Rhodocyclaceae bacterium]
MNASANDLLTVRALRKTFDGFQAIRGVDFSIGHGRVHAVIGPNGAGKSTLFNLITGLDRPDEGEVTFLGSPCSHMSPASLCRRGMVRSFQKSNTFLGLSVFENIQAAIVSRSGEGWKIWPPLGRRFADEVQEIAEQVGIADKLDLLPEDLAYGYQRQLELAIALASRPRLLLLDEPTAGMSSTDTHRAVALLKRIVEDLNIVLLITEHDMGVVFSLAERIIVLAEGQIIADGNPEDIRANAEVKRVYLGKS